MTETGPADTVPPTGAGAKRPLAPHFALMHAGFLLYASYSVIGKLAARSEFLSARFILLHAAVLLIIFAYAVLWQQALKRIQLSVASSNKAMTIVWGILFGRIFFGEEIKANMVAGAALIFAGILLLNGGADE